MTRVLVVDDEPAITDAVAYALESEGFEVDARDDGEQAIDAARRGSYDVILLDVLLPRLSGFEVCRRIRSESDVPILMLTARDAEVDRVLGLEIGADDYITKPFSMPELLGRIRAILRRRQLDAAKDRPTEYEVGNLRMDLVRHLVTVDGEQVRLTPSEYKILALFAADPGRVFSRREIMQHLWDSSYVGDERACDIHLSNLRRKIERDPGARQRITTVRGAGYKLEEV
jgi:two-component system response regulator RegX3